MHTVAKSTDGPLSGQDAFGSDAPPAASSHFAHQDTSHGSNDEKSTFDSERHTHWNRLIRT